MTPDIFERAFEKAIECALLRHGSDACPDDAMAVRESAPEFGDEAHSSQSGESTKSLKAVLEAEREEAGGC